MAREAIGEAFLSLRADASKLRGDISQALATTEKSLKAFGSKAQSAGKALSLGLSAPIAGIGGGILKMAGDFEAGMNRVQAATTASQAEFATMRNLAKELGSSTKFSATEAAAGMEILAKNGLTVTQIMGGAVDASLKLAAATGTDLAGAADVATDVMLQFGKQASELSPLVDQVTGVLLASKFGFDDYRLALGQAGSVAASSGVSIEDFNATIAATSSMFASGSDAGTSFKTFLLRLVPTTKAAAEAMDQYGLSFFDADGAMKGMAEVADMLRKNLGSLNEEARTDVLKTIFGTDALRTAIGLMNQGAEGMDRMTETIAKASAGDQAAALNKGLTGGMIQLRSAIEGLAIAIADSGLLDWVTQLVTKVTEVVRNFSQANPEMLKWGTIAAGVAAAIGPVVAAVGLFASGLGAIAAIGSGPLLGVAAAIAGIGAALALVDFGSLRDSAVSVFEEIKSAITPVFDAITGQVARMREAFGAWVAENPELIAGLALAWEDLKAAAADAFGKIWEAVKSALAGVGVAIGESNINFQSFLTVGVQAVTGLIEILTKFAQVAGSAISTVIEWQGKLAAITTETAATVVRAFTWITDKIVAAKDGIVGAVASIVSGIGSISAAGQKMYDAAFGNSWAADFFKLFFGYSDAFDSKVAQPINQSLATIGESMPKVTERARAATGEMNQLFSGLERNLSQAFQTGQFDALTFLNTIKAFFADQAAKAIMEPFQTGFDGVTSAAAASNQSVQSGFGTMFKNLSGVAGNWFSWLTQSFSSVGTWIMNSLSGIGRAVGGVFSGAGGAIGGAAKSVGSAVNGIGSAIGTGIGSIFGPIGGAIGGLIGGFFADGGRPPMGQASIVGERGPEWFVPDQPGTIIPSGKMRAAGSGGGGSSVNVVLNFSSGVQRAELAPIAAQIQQQVMSAITSGILNGGSFSRTIRI